MEFDGGAHRASVAGRGGGQRSGSRWPELRIEVDETTPLGETEVVSLEPVVVGVESGAFEDAKRPRHLSERSVRRRARPAAVPGARDRLDPAFGEAPRRRRPAACAGHARGTSTRSAGLSASGSAPRRSGGCYHFRIRHGFTDVADEAFDRLWTPTG